MAPTMRGNSLRKETHHVFPTQTQDVDPLHIRKDIERYSRPFKTGTSLLLEGDENECIFFVVEGWLALSKSLEDGQTQIIDFAIPGDFVDPSSADGRTSPVSVDAMTDGSVAIIPYARWETLTHDNAALRRRAHSVDAAEQARRAERMLRLGKGTAEMRVAYAILEFCVRLGSVCQSDDPVFHIPLTQKQLGDFIGLSSVHVCRTMRRMTRNGVIRMTDHMDIRVLEPQGLAEMAGVDQATLRREIMPEVV